VIITSASPDFLTRALTLFGEPPIVCDHPQTIGRISSESKEIQIVHVHGTYWYYDCCNLRGEVEKRAKDAPGSLTIPRFLDSLLRLHAPIVVGYSGWEGDVIMSALQRRLDTETPFDWYWFCYKRSDFDSLPSWLKSNANIRFVLPKVEAEREEMQSAGGASGLKPVLAAEMGTQGVPTLPARLVFDRMVESFGLKSPLLTSNPLRFFADHLRKSIFQESSQQEGGDIFSFESVISRVQQAAARDEKRARKSSLVEKELEGIREAVRRSAYKEALQNTIATQLTSASVKQKNEMIQLLFSATSGLFSSASGLNDNSSEELAAYDHLLQIAEDLEKKQAVDSRSAVAWCRSLRNKGFCLAKLQKYEEAIVANDEVVRRFGDSTEAVLREQVARVLVNKGFCLGELQKYEEAIVVNDEVVRLFGDSAEATLRAQVAKAMYNKGVFLRQLQKYEEAIVMYDEVVRRFGDSSEATLREWVAKALFNKGNRLGELQRNEEAIVVFDEVVRRVGDSTEPVLWQPVACALVSKGFCLGELQRNEEAIVVIDEVVRRFGDASEAVLREQVASALVNKGFYLGELQRDEEAIGVNGDVVRRFGDSAEAVLREQVAKALVNKGFYLGKLQRNKEAIGVYDEVVQRYSTAKEVELRRIAAKAMYLKYNLLQNSGQSDTAAAVVDAFKKLFAADADPEIQEWLKKMSKPKHSKGAASGGN